MGLDQQAAALRLQRVDALKKAYGARDPRVAEALLDYVEDISSTSERGKTLAALDEAARILDAAQDFSSEIRAALWMEFARYYRYTSPEKMRSYIDQAVDLLRARYRDTWTFPLALQLAARSRFELGQYEASESLFRETLAEVHRREPGASAWEIAPLAQMAAAQAALLKVAEAKQSFRASLAVSRKLNGETHNETLQSGSRLGAFLHATSRRAEGKRLLESALQEITRDKSKNDNAVAAVVYGLYGQSLLAEGQIEAAEKFLALDVADARRLYPESVPLSKGLLRLGVLYTALGRYGEAEKALDEALATWRHVAGTTAESSLDIPYLIERARFDLARGNAAAAIEKLKGVRPPANAAQLSLLLDETNAQVAFAQAYLQQGRVSVARHIAQAALEHVQHSPVRDYFQTLEADALLRLGQAQQKSGELKAARANLERALKLRAINDDPQSPWLAETGIALADCVADLGERGPAMALLAKAKAIHAAHRELGEHFKRPLRELVERLNRRNS